MKALSINIKDLRSFPVTRLNIAYFKNLTVFLNQTRHSVHVHYITSAEKEHQDGYGMLCLRPELVTRALFFQNDFESSLSFCGCSSQSKAQD